MTDYLWWLLGLPGLWLLLALGGWWVNIPAACCTVRRATDEEADAIRHHAAAAIDDEEAARLGFSFDGVYRVDLSIVSSWFVLWRIGRQQTYLAAYTMADPAEGGWSIDLVSDISRSPHAGLTTGTTRDGHVGIKRPGQYFQTFDTRDLATLWAHHQAGEVWVCERVGVDPEEVDETGEDALREGLREPARYALAHWWRMGVIPWQYFVVRSRRHNRRLAEIHGRA